MRFGSLMLTPHENGAKQVTVDLDLLLACKFGLMMLEAHWVAFR